MKCGWFVLKGSTFITAVPFRGQSARNLSGLSPRRDCGSKRVITFIFTNPPEGKKKPGNRLSGTKLRVRCEQVHITRHDTEEKIKQQHVKRSARIPSPIPTSRITHVCNACTGMQCMQCMHACNLQNYRILLFRFFSRQDAMRHSRRGAVLLV